MCVVLILQWVLWQAGRPPSSPQNPKGMQSSNLDLVGIKENSIMRWALVFLPRMPHGSLAPGQVALGKKCLSLGEEGFSSVRPSIIKLCLTSSGQAHAFHDLWKTRFPKKGSKPSFLSPSARAERGTGTPRPPLSASGG